MLYRQTQRVGLVIAVIVSLFAAITAAPLLAQPQATVAALAEAEQSKLLDTLKALVNIETGSMHRDGLGTAAEFIATTLKASNVRDYGMLTVLINGDEEISSPASRKFIAKMGSEHDAALSFEASRHNGDKLSLATSGIAMGTMTVKGISSHGGGAPERGVNALYVMAHQPLQWRDLSVPETGLKMNWTVANAGAVHNMIPRSAQASTDVRLLRGNDLQDLENKVNARIKNKLLPESQVSVTFENRRPPLEATLASSVLAAHAQTIYRALGKTLVVDLEPKGGGTHAAFAASNTKAAVIERFGL